jgi:transposase-like protein
VPAAVGDIQVNHCRMPSCANFGIPARTAPVKTGRAKGQSVPRNLPDAMVASCPHANCTTHGQAVASNPGMYSRYGKTSSGSQRYGCKACKSTFSVAQLRPPQPAAPPARRDLYKVHGNRKSTPALLCSGCKERVPIKSNAGIAEELERLSAPLRRHQASQVRPSCPAAGCDNHGKSVAAHRDLYHRHGTTKTGSVRWQCKACRHTFSSPIVATSGHRRILENEFILRLLMNKMPLRRICEVAQIGATSLYGKIDFLHRQAELLAGAHEQLLPDKRIERLFLSSDRQDYLVNWSDRKDKRPVQLSAIGTADDRTGYVFGMRLNYDGRLDPEQAGAEAAACGDYGIPYPHRRFARLWLPRDYEDASLTANLQLALPEADTLDNEIERDYRQVQMRDDVEVPPELTSERALPSRGMQVHCLEH